MFSQNRCLSAAVFVPGCRMLLYALTPIAAPVALPYTWIRANTARIGLNDVSENGHQPCTEHTRISQDVYYNV